MVKAEDPMPRGSSLEREGLRAGGRECCELKLGTGQQGTQKMARRLYQSWPWAPRVTGRSGRHLGDRKQVLGGGTARVVVMRGRERGQARTSFLAKGRGWTVTTSQVLLGGESADQGITAPGGCPAPANAKTECLSSHPDAAAGSARRGKTESDRGAIPRTRSCSVDPKV